MRVKHHLDINCVRVNHSRFTTSTSWWCNSMHASIIQSASQCARHALGVVSCWSVLRCRVTLPPHISMQTLTFGQEHLPSRGWPRGYHTSVTLISNAYRSRPAILTHSDKKPNPYQMTPFTDNSSDLRFWPILIRNQILIKWPHLLIISQTCDFDPFW